MIEIADLMDKRYARGGRGPEEYDCFGLFAELCRRLGRPIPDHPSPDSYADREEAILAEIEDSWQRLEAPVPGCAVVIRTGRFMSHIGMVLEGERFIHANEKTGITTAALDNLLWRERIEGFYAYRGRA